MYILQLCLLVLTLWSTSSMAFSCEGSRANSFQCVLARLRPGTHRQPSAKSPVSTKIQKLPANIQRIVNELNRVLDQNKNLIPAWVQLGFHSCVGGCDGCLDTTSPHNKGLIKTYDDLRKLQQKDSSVLNLADYLALAAVTAAKKGIKNATKKDINIVFRVGRSTCANPDKPDKHAEFPEGDDPNAIDILARDFRLTRKEAIALLGAHSLGKCNPSNTGFDGAWDFSEKKLDNAYFRSMTGTKWIASQSPGGKFQWNSEDGKRMMLHADLALFRHFSVSGSNALPSCKISQKCPSATTASQIRTYSKNEQEFHRDFVRAFKKMLERTNSRLSKP